MFSPYKQEGSEQKKSPLALLAATCSSIGKTEAAKQEAREPMTARQSPKSTSSANSMTAADGSRASINKISTDESKSSFKPYKHDEAKELDHRNATSSPEKPGFRAPSKDAIVDSLSHSNHASKSPDFRTTKAAHMGSFTPFQYPYLTDSAANAHCYYPSPSRMCGMYFDIGHQPSAHHSCLKTDCSGNCGSALIPSPPSLAPTTSSTASIRPIFPSPSVSTSSTVKSHGLPSSGTPRSSSLYPRCNCGYCNQAAPSHEGNLKGVQHQHPGLTQYHRDYLQATSNCPDPYCTNCKSQVLSAGTTGSSSRAGYGPHCFHHHHDSPPTVLPGSLSSIAPAMSHLYPYGFMLRPQADQANPFVCNWVQDSKNCGKNFATSDELLQHLRTHTSAANTTAPPLHTPCNIPGCPCNLKTLSASPSRIHTAAAARYHPYFIPSPGALHPSSFHSAITPYASAHGIPYGSPFKPY